MRKGYSYLFHGALVCLLVVSQASANCLCAEKGIDYCACNDAIRPAPKLISRLKLPAFPPIGDSCWCGKQSVEPAVPPKPPCKTPEKCDCKCNQPPPPPPCFANLGLPNLVPAGVPADPISISLALSAGKAFAVPEGRLSYGPVNTPLNDLQQVLISNIPEEKLYGLNSDVIELKKRIARPEIIYEEPEEEELELPAAPPYLTYQELGYGPAKFASPLFERAKALAPPAPPAKKLVAGCGFMPGRINMNAKLLPEVYAYPFSPDCV